MLDNRLSRRCLLSALSAPLFAALPARKLKVVVTGGHPGDPECGCAGTIARYTDLGHEVVLLYLNRGEGYCHGYDPGQCGPVRTVEARKACQILKARPAFLSQWDGRAIVDAEHYDDVRRWFDLEKPDVVFAQWPIDNHRDHRALSTLVLDAWLASAKKPAFYYYEVTDDSMMFRPSEYVDVSAMEERRHAACYAHVSQTPDKWYPGQTELLRTRGRESGYERAEAFLRHWQSKSGLLP